MTFDLEAQRRRRKAFEKRWGFVPATGDALCSRRVVGKRCICHNQHATCHHFHTLEQWDDHPEAYQVDHGVTFVHCQPYLGGVVEAFKPNSSLRRLSRELGFTWAVTADPALCWYWPGQVASIFIWDRRRWHMPGGFWDPEFALTQADDIHLFFRCKDDSERWWIHGAT